MIKRSGWSAKPWSKEEEDYLKSNYINQEYEEIAKKLGRNTNAVGIRRTKLNLPKKPKFDSEIAKKSDIAQNLGKYAIKGEMVGNKSPNYKKIFTEEHRKNISLTHKGKKQSKNAILKRSVKHKIWWEKNKDTEVGKKIISKMLENKPIITPEMRKKQGDTMRQGYKEGKIHIFKGKESPHYGKKPWNKDIKGYKLNRVRRIKFTEEERKRVSEYTKKAMNRPEVREKIKKINQDRCIKGLNKTIFKKGEEHPNWLGGISFEPYGIEFNDNLKEQIRKRDNYICQECNKTQEELNRLLSVHHVDYNKKNNNPCNLISLCFKCHPLTNSNREHWKQHFMMKMFIKELFNPQNILIFNENRQLIGMDRIGVLK